MKAKLIKSFDGKYTLQIGDINQILTNFNELDPAFIPLEMDDMHPGETMSLLGVNQNMKEKHMKEYLEFGG